MPPYTGGMWRLLELYLPVIFPSWRFFAEIGAGPRVEYRLNGGPWVSATTPPACETLAAAALRLFWNRDGNERLFLVTCAERILTKSSPKAEDELARRLAWQAGGVGRLIFRIRLVDADGCETAFVSAPYDL